MVGATGREAGVAHQRHGCELAGRVHGTVIAVLTLAAVFTTTRSSRKTGPAGATHREWDDLLRPAEPAPSRGRPARSLGSACAGVLDGVPMHPGASAGLL